MSDKKSLVLAVDDNENVLELIRESLSGDEYHVITTTDGMEAIELALRHNPDVILLDLIMPNIDGMKVLKLMRKKAELAEVPIVFLTATKDEKTVKHAEKLGVTSYLTKPFSPLLLQKRVKSFCKRTN